MSFTENPVDMELSENVCELKRYRWIERVDTHSGQLALSVNLTCSPLDHPGHSGHFYIRVSPYWPGTSSGMIAGLREGTDVMLADMVESLSFDCLTRYVEMCCWAAIVSVSRDVAVLRGRFSPELFRARNPWAFGPAEE